MKRVILSFGLILIMGSCLYEFSPAQVTADDLSWDFECGSLESASTAGPNDIRLTLRLDDQHGDLYGWYYFAIDQNAMGQTVTFRIVNRDGWMNHGNMCFRQQFDQDSARIALTIPYTYSTLLADLDSLSESPYVEYEMIGPSVHGRDIPMVTISNPDFPDDDKRTVWITSRQHPMETPPSFMIKSMMKYVIGRGERGGEKLLERLIFKLVPMINVDGVAEGYSRHNVNGINLNRCWCSDSTYAGEEPEVEAAHRAIDDWIYGGHRIDFYNDMHAAPDLYDFGYRMSLSYTYRSYYDDATTFLKKLDINDVYHQWQQWRDMDRNYADGVVIIALYDQHEMMGFSNEHSWSRRGNGSYHTIEDLYSEGPMYADAIYDYLFPIWFSTPYGRETDTVFVGDDIHAMLMDFDENEYGSRRDTVRVPITSLCGDIERLTLIETTNTSGLFWNSEGIPLSMGPPHIYNGILEIAEEGPIRLIYQDNDYSRDRSWDIAEAVNPTWADDNTNPADYKPDISNHPNPFNASTDVEFTLSEPGAVRLSIYNIRGQRIMILLDGWMKEGPHAVRWNAEKYSSGIYFCGLETGEQSVIRRMVLIK
jgi:hypothetical protein